MIPFFEWFVHSGWGLGFVLFWGAAWGSFANVCIVRIPRQESVVRPASRCPGCNQPIAFYDNVPILSFLLLWGQCRTCRQPISFRYPLVEAVCMLLSVLVFWRFVLHADASDSVAKTVARFVVYSHFEFLLLILAAIDVEQFILPDRLTLPAIGVFFVAGRLLGDVSVEDSLIGLAAGYGVLWFVGAAYVRLTKREGLGMGDAKLFALIGVSLGWPALPWTLCVGSLLGTVVALPMLWLTRLAGAGTPFRHTALPFGPFLAVGASSYVLLLLCRSLEHVLSWL